VAPGKKHNSTQEFTALAECALDIRGLSGVIWQGSLNICYKLISAFLFQSTSLPRAFPGREGEEGERLGVIRIDSHTDEVVDSGAEQRPVAGSMPQSEDA